MKKKLLVTFAFIFAFCALIISVGFLTGWVTAGTNRQSERWGNPPLISYQGQVWDGETPYNGVGYFKFAIVDGVGTHYWSNDGASPPEISVPLTVENGLFTVLLGDTTLPGMTQPLTSEMFYYTERFMRVWFSPDDVTFTQMPDQVIASVPYAFSAGSAAYAQHLGLYTADDYQLRVNGACMEGQMIKEILYDGSVVCEDIPAYPTYSITELDTVGVYSSIAIGGDGLGLISYYANQNLKVAHCENINCTNATITTVDSEGIVGQKPSIAIGPDGFGLISYWDSTNNGLKIAHCLNADCSDATISALQTTGDQIFPESSIVVGADGLGLIAYEVRFEYDYFIQVAHCSNSDCSANSGITLQATLPQGISIAIGADDRALISYYDYGSQEYKVVHCNDLYCYDITISMIDDSDFSGSSPDRYTDITIGEEGFGVVTYYDWTWYEVKVAYCRNAECSSAGTYTVYSGASDDGAFPAIMTGIDGAQLVVIYDHDQYDLKVIHFLDDYGFYEQDFYVLDEPHVVSPYSPSSTLGADGLGLISYSDDSHLTVIHCSNEFCMPINWEH